jgi:hypothetical protein
VDNPSPRIPEAQSGKFGNISEFGSVDGLTLQEVDDFLISNPNLKRFHLTLAGYREYLFQDASSLYIRPNGEVIRIPKPMYTSDGWKIKGYRYSFPVRKTMRFSLWMKAHVSLVVRLSSLQ